MFLVRCAIGNSLYSTVTLLLLSILWLFAAGCGRLYQPDPTKNDEQEKEIMDKAHPSNSSLWPPDATPINAPAPSMNKDGSTGIKGSCKEDSDCETSNKCELPICTASGTCSFIPLEDGMPCYSATGNQICIDGICRTSYCSDEYDDCHQSDNPQWQILVTQSEFLYQWNQISGLLLIDSAGNPIVVFQKLIEDTNNTSSESVEVTKYNLEGQVVWQWASNEEETSLIPTLDSNSSIRDIYPMNATIDKSDHVVIAGFINVEDQFQKHLPWLMKLNSEGQLLWSTIIDEEGSALNGVAVGDQGNIMALMSADKYEHGEVPWMENPTIELFDSDGTYREEDSESIDGNFIFGKALSAGTVGGVSRFLLAGSQNDNDDYTTYLLLLDSNGKAVWDTPIRYGDTSDNIGFLRALVAHNGDIVVLGKSGNLAHDFPYHCWFERYTPNKTARFEEKKGFRTHQAQSQFYITLFSLFRYGPYPMTVDAKENVLFAYSLREFFQDGTLLIIDKYDSEGEPVWRRPFRYDTGPDDHYAPREMAVSNQGNIFVLVVIWSDHSTNLWLLHWREPHFSDQKPF